MTTRSNTPIALCESDSYQIRDLGSLLFFKVGVKAPSEAKNSVYTASTEPLDSATIRGTCFLV